MAQGILRSSLRWLFQLLLVLGSGVMGAALVNLALGWVAPHMNVEAAIPMVAVGFLGGSLLAALEYRRRRQRRRRRARID